MVPPGLGMDGGVVKEVIHLKTVTLIPPPPGSPMPTTRERPPGCKTIFVGGLAENTTGQSPFPFLKIQLNHLIRSS